MFLGHVMGAGLFMLMMGLSRVFWFVLLVAAVLFLITTLRARSHTRTTAYPFPTQGTPPPALSAMEILRQRYARGEIDGTTFDHMRERLEGSAAAQAQQEPVQAQEPALPQEPQQ